MRGYVLVSAVCLSTIMACANELPGDLGGTTAGTGTTTGAQQPSEARAYFDANVEPILAGTCADCHANSADVHGAPDFLGLAVDEYYDKLTTNPIMVGCDIKNSILLLKGLDPGHAGPPLTDGQHDKVMTWLSMEAEERFGGSCSGPSTSTSATTGGGTTGGGGDMTGGTTGAGGSDPGPITADVAMKQFGDCMTLDDWISTGMPMVANQLSDYNNNDVPCYSCHNAGSGENWMPNPNLANADTEIANAFEKMRYVYASFNLVRYTVNNQDGSFKDLVPAYRWRDKGQEGTDHPSYQLKAEYLAYYEAWFAATYEKWVNVPCYPNGGAGGAGGGP